VALAGRPLYQWSLEALQEAESVGPVVIAFPDGVDEELPVGARAVAGGATRSASVANAVALIGEAELIVIHDAARPLVTPELVDACLDKLVEDPDADGVIAAVPISDTVKRATAHTITATEDREHLWAAQTPQVFRAEPLRQALAADPKRTAAATDEAMLVEKDGGKVLIEPASAENLKVTTPTDLRLAELLLRSR
jgi:2-C-methyl-D-erythritol 4-phosphate cytidylyltransferase